MTKIVGFTQDDALEATRKALKTWYPVGDELRFTLKPASMGLAGEVGELTDLSKKWSFKKGWADENDFKTLYGHEVGDIWYYLRILSFMSICGPGMNEHAYPLGLLTNSRYRVPREGWGSIDMLIALLGLEAAKVNILGHEYKFLKDMGMAAQLELKTALTKAVDYWFGLAYMAMPESLKRAGINPAHFITTMNWGKLKGGAHGWSEEIEFMQPTEAATIRIALARA